tara:strand:- start:319 stop:606 length:288 start_codon:yes stop_codon:yes gene_type:complete
MAMKKGSKVLGIDSHHTLMKDAMVGLKRGAKIQSNSGPKTTNRNMVGKVQQGNSDDKRTYRAAKGSEFMMLSDPKATKSVSFSSKPKAKVVAKKK